MDQDKQKRNTSIRLALGLALIALAWYLAAMFVVLKN